MNSILMMRKKVRLNMEASEIRSPPVTQTAVEVEVNLRPTFSRPVCPGVRRPSGTYDQFFLSS
jgi:hypothetical protein